MHDGWMFGMGWFWLLVVVLVVALIWAALRPGSTRGGQGGDSGERRDAEEVLRDRLARGEIDEEEYRSRLRTLREER